MITMYFKHKTIITICLTILLLFGVICQPAECAMSQNPLTKEYENLNLQVWDFLWVSPYYVTTKSSEELLTQEVVGIVPILGTIHNMPSNIAQGQYLEIGVDILTELGALGKVLKGGALVVKTDKAVKAFEVGSKLEKNFDKIDTGINVAKNIEFGSNCYRITMPDQTFFDVQVNKQEYNISKEELVLRMLNNSWSESFLTTGGLSHTPWDGTSKGKPLEVEIPRDSVFLPSTEVNLGKMGKKDQIRWWKDRFSEYVYYGYNHGGKESAYPGGMDYYSICGPDEVAKGAYLLSLYDYEKDNESTYDNPWVVSNSIPVPLNIQYKKLSNNKVRLTWDVKTSGQSQYIYSVEDMTPWRGWMEVGQAYDTKCLVDKRTSGQYKYRIRTLSTDGSRLCSSYSTEITVK